VKVLFIGEGSTDIGKANSNPRNPRPASGVVPALARKICPSISASSIAMTWTEVPRFSPSRLKRGYEHKICAAALLAVRNECAGTICIADRDRDADRLVALAAGTSQVAELPGCRNHRIVSGVAVESIEAWTLGSPEAIAKALGLEGSQVRTLYPRGIDVESLWQQSGKEEHRPKRLLEQITQLKHRDDDGEFREAVAQLTEPLDLERACPSGFGPFAKRLREVFSA
jgi:hypothetical protein